MRVGRGALALLLLCVLMPPTRAVAGENRWTSSGPFGGFATSIAGHPTRSEVVLAGSFEGGLFRSTDSGRTWRRRRGVPAYEAIASVAFAPSNPSIAYAANYRGIVFKSSDAGRSWARVGNVSGEQADSVVVHPRRSRTLFVASDNQTFRSRDGGRTWTEVLSHPGDTHGYYGRSLAIPLTKPNVIYNTGVSGLQISRDGGGTWKWADVLGTRVVAHPRKGSVVYIADGRGVSKSTDGGRTFRRVFSYPRPDTTRSMAINPRRPSQIYVSTETTGVFRLTRGGARGSSWDKGLPSQVVPSIAVLRSGLVLAGPQNHGPYRRDAGARRWRLSHHGFLNCSIYSVAVPRTSQSVVYAGVRAQGVARSTDNGRSWRWRGLRRRTVFALAVHPRRADVVYAATDRGVFKTSNAGRRWRRILARRSAVEVVVSQSNPSVVYASSLAFGVFRSADGGATWTRTTLEESEIYAIAVHPRRPNTLFAGGNYHAVVKSTDGGRTWKMGEGMILGEDPEDIAIDPQRPERVFVSMVDVGILRSVDAGASWKRMTGGNAPQGGAAVIVDPQRPRRVYASVGDGWGVIELRNGLYRSLDSGRTWERLQGHALARREMSALALGANGAILHAGTGGVEDHGAGLFRRRVD